MVTSGTNEIKLVLSVDRADIERQLSKGFDASIGQPPGGGGSGGGGGGGKAKPTKVNPGKSFMAALKPLAALFGISLTLQGMFKMSKIMQTTASALGAILGAMIDMLLMPFMPLIVDMLRGLISLLPGIRDFADNVIAPFVNKMREDLKGWWKDNEVMLRQMWDQLKAIARPLLGVVFKAWQILFDYNLKLLSFILNAITEAISVLTNIKNLIGRLLNFFGMSPGGIASGAKEAVMNPWETLKMGKGNFALGMQQQIAKASKKDITPEDGKQLAKDIGQQFWEILTLKPQRNVLQNQIEIHVDKEGNATVTQGNAQAKGYLNSVSGESGN